MHPGVTREQVVAATGWPVRFSDDVATTDEPTDAELDTLRSVAGGMNPFTYDQLPARIVFGAGRLAEVGAEVERLGGRRVMLISDWAAAAPASCGDGAARVSVGAGLGRGRPACAGRARRTGPLRGDRAASIDCIVCIGGGSSTGLAKAMALSHAVPIVAVPTTYAGSEQTSIYGLTGGRRKETGKNAIVQPKTVVYDPELTVGLPPQVTGPSAFNALAHSVEALYAPGNNPVTSALALEGVRAIHDSLPTVMASPGDVEARGTLVVRRVSLGGCVGHDIDAVCTTSCVTCWVAGSTSCTPMRTR